METKKNKRSAKKIITIVCLSMALLIALGAFSFAWIRNSLEFAESEITAGKMLYKLTMYYKGADGALVVNELFDSSKDPNELSQSDTLIQNLGKNAHIDVAEGNEVFFVIEKLENSIDFDFALYFDSYGLNPAIYERIGSFDFRLKDDKEKVSTFADEASLKAYIGDELKKAESNSAVPESLGYIWDVSEKATAYGTQKYACIRLAIDKKPGADSALDGYTFKLNTKFCVAQKDGLPEDVAAKKTIREVHNKNDLEKAMKEYTFNDEIRVVESFDYDGDLVFTRPCIFSINRATLTVKGNVVFSYLHEGEFKLDTASEGHLKILQNNGAGGDFKIDLADATITLVGANNATSGKADVYVAGNFFANAAQFSDYLRNDDGEFVNENGDLIDANGDGIIDKNEEKNLVVKEKGLIFNGLRVCDINENLKPMTLNGPTRIYVSKRTTLGTITAGTYCRTLGLVNHGTIEKINLASMKYDPNMMTAPCVDIDNYGQFTDPVILLPDNAKRFQDSEKNSSADNTRIIANEGSGPMKAITSNDIPEGATESKDFFPPEESIDSLSEFFYSRGDKGENRWERDDIDYKLRKQFVEMNKDNSREIIIHYETPSALLASDNSVNYNELKNLNSLESYVKYYENSLGYEVEYIKKVTIICYGDKVLTTNDYNFIKSGFITMTDLDLSDAVSKDKTVPAEAFKGMTSLTNVKMSESDTVWGKNIFTGTNVVEITLPQSLLSLDNGAYPTKEFVLDNIKYVRTSTTVVDGLWKGIDNTRFFFTADQSTCNKYREILSGNNTWASMFFVDNGAKQSGNYFLRYDENDTSPTPKCEFVVYTGDTSINWVSNENFDFSKIAVEINSEGVETKTYTISSYDDYALYNRLSNVGELSISFGEHLEKLGRYSFAAVNTMTRGIVNVTFNSDVQLMGNVFTYQKLLSAVSGDKVTTLSGGKNFSDCVSLKTVYLPKLSNVEGNQDLYNCYALDRVDISVIELDGENADFYSAKNISSYQRYAKFYIHTENAKASNLYAESFTALAAKQRFIFVNEDYAKFYKITPEYTGLTEMGSRELNDLLKADADGNPITGEENPAYYYVVDDGKVHLVACLLTDINNPDSEFATISTIDGKPVTKIGSAAYHFTKITANSIKISDGIKALGNYAFYSELCNKNCIDLKLNQVVRAGKGAFQYCNMATVAGDLLEEVGKDTFSNNRSLHIVKLPNLHKSRESLQQAPTVVFLECPNLRFSEVGYSADIEYDNKESMKTSYIRLLHIKGTLDSVVLSKVNTFVNQSMTGVTLKMIDTSSQVHSYKEEFNNGLINAGSSFANIYYSDYYEKNVETLQGISGTVTLPAYVYYKESDGNLTLFSVSPDFNEFAYDGDNTEEYVAPNGISQLADKTYTAKTETPTLLVTKIGRHAYGAVRNISVPTFTLGSNIGVIEYGAFSGSAYYDSTSVITTVLDDIDCLDLASVTEVGDFAFKQSKFKTLVASALQIIGNNAFDSSVGISELYLPAYKEAGTYAFVNCSALVEVTLGEYTQKLSEYMFFYASNLQSITILRNKSLNSDPAFSVDNNLVYSSQANQITLKVYAGILNEYKSKYGSSFGGINISGEKLVTFENVSTIGGVSYYWNIISGTNTAYIDYIEGAGSPTEFEIPSSFKKGETTYTVSWVTSSAIKALGNKLTVLTLPNDMQYLAFSASDLPDSLQDLVINETNTKFATVGGILYSKDMKTLFVYPQNKSNSVVTLNEKVTEIYAEAFYSVNNIVTLNIKNAVTINDRAFAEAVSIKGINFSSETASIFAGRDIFAGVSNLPEINVPEGKVNDYKANVYVDTSIISKMS